MALETAQYIHQLNASNPSGSDRIHQGDDHLRLLKAVLKATFPNLTGPVTRTQDQLNNPFVYPIGIISAWYGSADSVPAGWALCDGRTVSRTDGGGNITLPDLRDRVILGAGGTYAPLATPGSAVVTPTTGSAGDHTHTVAGGEHTHTAAVSSVSTGGSLSTTTTGVEKSNPSGTAIATATFNAPAAHTHTATIGEASHTHTVTNGGAHSHSVSPVSTLQPSMALHFIMKV